MQANGHAQPLPDLRASDDFPSLGAAPTASSAAAANPGRPASAWSNGGGAAISRNLQSQQGFVSLGELSLPVVGS